MHAVFADFVTSGRHDPATRHTTDNKGLTDQSRIVVFLDGRVKRVHVDVEDRADHGKKYS
jgi:hypothetical protein